MTKTKLDTEMVLRTVLDLLGRHQPEELSYSLIARKTKVARSTLYYYFGSSIDGLIEQATQYGLKAFMQIYEIGEDLDHATSWGDYHRRRLLRSVPLIARHPWAPGLYFRYRNHPGMIGKQVRALESKYIKDTIEHWKKKTGETLDPLAVKITGALKLGWMYGLAAEDGIRLKPGTEEEGWITQLSDALGLILRPKK